MDKRKMDELGDAPLALSVVLFGVVMFALFCGWCFVDYVYNASVVSAVDCVDVSQSDFVMVGVEGHRDVRKDAPALLDALGAMVLRPIDGVPVDAVRHLDMAFYDGWRLQGTMLFWQVGMREWYVQVNDDFRGDCGVYSVDDASVLLVMDGMR